MVAIKAEEIRNICLVGHGDSGKTTLADAMLFKAGANSRAGSIDDGTSVFDFEPEEKERKTSVILGIASCSWNNKLVNILDAPGYPDFIGEAISGLAATENAILCINALSGIMVNTRRMWEEAKKLGVGITIMINKMDLENVLYLELINSIRETFGKECVPLFLPRGSGPAVSGGVDIMDGMEKVPKELLSLAEEGREKLMEIDDGILEKYLNGEKISSSEIKKQLGKAILSGKIVPILCSSVKKDMGVGEFLDFIMLLPSPADISSKKVIKEDKQEEISCPVKTQLFFSGQVFKSTSDPFVGRMSFIKIYSGSLTQEDEIFNQRTKKAERIGNLFKPYGKKQMQIQDASAGDIIGVTKVDNLMVSDTVFTSSNSFKYSDILFPVPMVSLAVEPKTASDEQRLSLTLQKIAESDPTFKIGHDTATKEFVITGMTQLHIDVILSQLKRKYDLELITKIPKIAYKETVMKSAEGHYKHKKQTGGHGQYGEVYLKVSPLPRGSEFKFNDEITQGRIPNQYIPAVEKGVREVLERGVIAGYQIVDIEVTLFDGSYHEVDSSEAAFKIAASKAFQLAFKEARPSLLEPIVNIGVTVPSKFMGDITGDINSKRGRITGINSLGNLQVIEAQIPLAEVVDYSTRLRSMTAGEGSYVIKFSHYDIVPQKISEVIIARSKKAEKEEE